MPAITIHSGTCAVEGCFQRIPRSLCFCLKHWMQISPDLQARLADTYQPGQHLYGWRITETFQHLVYLAIARISATQTLEGKAS